MFFTAKGEISFSHCLSCFGLFLPPATVRSVTSSPERAKTVKLTLEESPAAAKLPLKYLKCPECLQLMNRLNFGRTSGVLVNTCLDHGTWFDAGGLPRVLEFVAQGKLAEIMEEERRELEEELKKLSDTEDGSSFLIF